MLTPKNVLILASLLFAIGAYGVLARRNLLVILLSVELMLNAVNLAAATMARMFMDTGGSVVVLVVIGIAAVEAGVGLALLIVIYRYRRTTDANDLHLLNG